MSFDESRNQFRYEYYDSSGGVHQSLGSWNAEAKTMTSIIKDSSTGNTTTIIAKFAHPNKEHWSIVTKDRENKQTMLITGTNTRRVKK